VVVAVIDDCSRRLIHAECFISQEAWVVETTLKKAMTKPGLPASLSCDYVSRHIIPGFAGYATGCLWKRYQAVSKTN